MARTPDDSPVFTHPTNQDHPDPNRAGLRVAVADIDDALGAVSRSGDARLTNAWARLVNLLALGPAPALRACPRCGRAGMRDAKICGYCWERLSPPGP
ncbi:MAG: hypothetical protein JNK82_12065 [Myxococcaceae bacterium]|nr:hypothetical protein [Myxococcaceae bacterium]